MCAIAHVGILLRDAVDEQLKWFAFIAGQAVFSIAAEGFLFDFHGSSFLAALGRQTVMS